MPELPEVETVVRSLRPGLVGARVTGVWTSGLPLRLARPLDVRSIERLCLGARIRDVRRRGKYVLVDLLWGPGRVPPPRDLPRGGLLVHLGMSGRLRIQPRGTPREKHTHVVLALDGDRELRFVDPRRFGLVRAEPSLDHAVELRDLGPDPLEALDAAGLAASLATSRAPLKAFLLDQRRVAGLGNIYVSEALFRARLHPTLPARRARRHAAVLVRAIREALEVGIRNRGTTLRDYVDAEGDAGDNRAALLVYGREGEPCTVCRSPVRRRVDAQRSTFFCARCQRR